MRRYYTRACNFYYGNESKLLVDKKKSIPINGNKKISFDQIEIISRVSKRKISIKDINSLAKSLKKQIKLDLKKIKSKLKIPLNLEIAATKEMLNIALKSRPPFVCIVPEKRKEVTTEGGLNLNYNKKFLSKIIEKLKKNKSRVSLFIEPSLSDINKSKKLNADCVEIHTGKLCNLINKKKKL